MVIVKQSTELGGSASWRMTGLLEGQKYTQSSWSGSGTLTIKVCSLDTMPSSGSSRVLV